MSEPDEGARQILASPEAAQRISRRAFMSGSVVAAFAGGSILLAACSKGGTSSVPRLGRCVANPRGSAAVLPLGANTTTRSSSRSSPRNWDPKTHIDTYTSNENMITKLVAAQGSSGYDIVVPTGPYIPQMVDQQPAAGARPLPDPELPEPRNGLHEPVVGSPTTHTRSCKDWGTVGWIVDKQQIKTPIHDLAGLHQRRDDRGQRATSRCSTPRTRSMGVYFWANGIDWTTTNSADLDAYEKWSQRDGAAREGVRVLPRLPVRRAGNYGLVARVERRRPAGVQLVQGPEPVRVGSRRADTPSCGWTTGRSCRARRTRTRPTRSSTSSWIRRTRCRT